MTTVNAFHPDYMKTYHPEMLSAVRLESTQHANGVIAGGRSKATRENKHGKTVNSINAFPKTVPSVKERTKKMLEVTNFYMYSRAGTANTTKTKKKA